MTHAAMDASAFAEMRSEMGEIFGEVARTYMEYMPEQLVKLGVAIDSANTEETFNIAHTIKSSSSSIGALGLAKTAEEIELLGRNGTTEGAAPLYAELKIRLADVISFLKQELANS